MEIRRARRLGDNVPVVVARKKKGFGQWVSACIHQRLARLARGWERDFLGTVIRSRARARCVRHFTRTHSNWRRDTRPCHPRTSFPLGTLYIRALCGRFTPSAMRPPSRHSSMVHAPRVSPSLLPSIPLSPAPWDVYPWRVAAPANLFCRIKITKHFAAMHFRFKSLPFLYWETCSRLDKAIFYMWYLINIVLFVIKDYNIT